MEKLSNKISETTYGMNVFSINSFLCLETTRKMFAKIPAQISIKISKGIPMHIPWTIFE